ncbi:MAG: hypothetical protein DCF22_08020 [Leptolyngbya sp.]|nr:MAG: hypothetical protein DCF22_08020 [Leptolyngbya sp.]
MTIDNTAGASSRGTRSTTQKARASRSTKAVASKSTATSEQATKTDTLEVTGEDVMSADDMVKLQTPDPQDKAGSQSAIAIHHHTHVAADGPLMSSEFDVAETISSAGIRPIEVSHLELAGSFMNGRPIATSNLTVYGMLTRDRPVFNSDVKMVEGFMLMNRPVMASSPDLMQGSLLPGGRPIASNQNVDPEPETLMGYLD